jgi:lysophospholipase L1-like esterase
MKIKFSAFLLFLALWGKDSFGQSAVLKWRNPQAETQNVIEGQAWGKEVKYLYDRLPARAEKDVRKQVWDLSRQSAGLMIRFRANTEQIKIRYTVGGVHSLPHMPATGVSGIDLYAVSSDGEALWCAGKYAFKDTISYDFQNLNANDPYHKHGREYRLYLPLYNSVKWLEIGVPEGAEFTFLPVRPEKPIVAYGTSIMQGACASRPGMAWTSILSRKMDRPLINLGFSGNGRLEKEVVDLVAEVEASVYILDCLPNLTIRTDADYSMTADEVARRLKATVRTLRNKHPQTPIALAGHPGCTDGAINPQRLSYCQEANRVLSETFAELKSEGVQGIYLIPSDDFQQGIETMVDGTHPTDLGMMLYAEGYEKHLRKILHEEIGISITAKPRTQLRELNNYDWEGRHRDILAQNRTSPPKTVVIGNSITHFWGGLPKGPRAVGELSWADTFGKSKVLNAGYGWDRIENVLWRVYSGELDGFTADQVFVNIGTNNLDHNSNEEIGEGWQLLISALKKRQPTAGLYMMGIYPRRNQEVRVAKLNLQLAKICGVLNVHYINPGKVFLKHHGKIDESLFSDGLHPNEKGYTLLGAEIKTYVK